MKALKLALVAAILSVAMISYAGINPKPAQKMVKISLQKAVQNPGLKAAMHDQVCLKFLKFEGPRLYSATVEHNNIVYKIYGRHFEWIRFLKTKPPVPGNTGVKQIL